MKKCTLQKNAYQGFTLIEVLVAVSLFVTIVTLAMGALFQAQSVNAHLQANQTILDGMSLSFETMTRDIRYGTIFYCDTTVPDPAVVLKRKSCPFDLSVFSSGPGTAIFFKPVDAVDPNDRVGYYATSSKIYRWSYTNGTLETPVAITSDDITIDILQFYVTGASVSQGAVDNGNVENATSSSPDNIQPVINVIATGKTTAMEKNGKQVKFELQTTVAPRGIDD
jgi:prepilin-type N-terminal cleavage/methylation domain-containing protein